MWQAALLMPMLLTAPGGGTAESLAARIESVAAPQAEAGLLSGVLLVARDDEMLFHRAYGHASWELRVPNTPSTRFAVASIAKPMSRMLAHLLVEAGRLELDAPVDRYLQDFPRGPKGGRPTIAHLLAHRSGVPHRVTLASEEVEPLRPADIVRRVEQAGLLFEPGSRRLYSSAGFTCLARVIEIVEGKPFEEVLADQVFAPARMTSAISETGEVLMDRRALPHRLGAHGDRLVVKKGRHKDLRFLTGAGAVYATAGDLLRFVRAIRSGVFGPDHWKRELGADPRAWRGWTGRTGGYEASVDVLAAEDLIFVFLSNLRSAANWQIREQVKRVLTGGAAAAIPDQGRRPVSRRERVLSDRRRPLLHSRQRQHHEVPTRSCRPGRRPDLDR